MRTNIFLKCPSCKNEIRLSIKDFNRLSIIDNKNKEHDECPFCHKTFKLIVNEDYKYCYFMVILPVLLMDFIVFYFFDLALVLEIIFFILSIIMGFYILALFNYRLYKNKIIRVISHDKEYVYLEDDYLDD